MAISYTFNWYSFYTGTFAGAASGYVFNSGAFFHDTFNTDYDDYAYDGGAFYDIDYDAARSDYATNIIFSFDLVEPGDISNFVGGDIDAPFDWVVFDHVTYHTAFVGGIAFNLVEQADGGIFYGFTCDSPFDFRVYDEVVFDACNFDYGFTITFFITEPADTCRFKFFTADFDDGDYDFVHVDAENRTVIMPYAMDVAFVRYDGGRSAHVSDDEQGDNVSSRNLRKEKI